MAKKQNTLILPRNIISGIVTTRPGAVQRQGDRVVDRAIQTVNRSISDLRGQLTNPSDSLRLLKKVSGEVKMAIASFVHLGNTPVKYLVYDNATHQISGDGYLILSDILTRFNITNDYSTGFDSRPTITQFVSSCIQETVLTGAVAAELVLDKNRLATTLLPVSPSTLRWKKGKDGKVYPYQVSGSTKDIELDIPTFFYSSLDQDPTMQEPESPFVTAPNRVVFHSETLEGIRRAIDQAGHARLGIELNADKVRQAAPESIRNDPEKLSAWFDQTKAKVSAEVASLGSNDAFVYYDTAKPDFLQSDIASSGDYTPILESVDSSQAVSLMTPPAILGKRNSSGSQNTASTESLVFLQHVTSLRDPTKVVLEKALTLALRLEGFPGYVTAEFEPVSLRPKLELAAFRAMEQAQILEQLSLGFLSDNEGAAKLSTGPRAPGAPKLSGTFFYNNNNITGQLASSMAADNSSIESRTLNGNTPTKSGGRSQ